MRIFFYANIVFQISFYNDTHQSDSYGKGKKGYVIYLENTFVVDNVVQSSKYVFHNWVWMIGRSIHLHILATILQVICWLIPVLVFSLFEHVPYPGPSYVYMAKYLYQNKTQRKKYEDKLNRIKPEIKAKIYIYKDLITVGFNCSTIQFYDYNTLYVAVPCFLDRTFLLTFSSNVNNRFHFMSMRANEGY